MRALYQDLINLTVDDNTKFYFSDGITSFGTKMRTFSYHIANYSDWLMPGAMHARGIMFEMDGEVPVRIASRPPMKFFNLSELKGWVGMEALADGMILPDLNAIDYYMDKRDGSLISSFTDTDKTSGVTNVLLKSKTSIRSTQANDASVWLYHEDRADLLEYVTDWEVDGYTVNFEWTGPTNQIVLGYDTHELRILNVINRETGKLVDVNELMRDATFEKYAVDIFAPKSNSLEWLDSVYEETGIEGYILNVDGMLIKVKTNWYVALHHTKDSINDSKRLLTCCAENCTDDLLQMFKDDPISIEKIRKFDLHYTSVVKSAHEKVYAEWFAQKHLDRKGYAIYMNGAFGAEKHWFGIAMKMYEGGSAGLIDQIVDVIKKYPEKFVPTGY